MTLAPLSSEMLWHDYAPSSVAERILEKQTDRTILPAPASARRDRLGFECHLKSNGVGDHFSIAEIVTPNDRRKAQSVGYNELVPPGHTWGVVCLLVWLADQLREAVGSPVGMRNLWRPQSYNRQVAKSAITSDHPNACGIDLDFGRSSARQEAEDWLAGWVVDNNNVARLSVGLGDESLHVGVLSPNGSRHWKYDSYKQTTRSEFRALG